MTCFTEKLEKTRCGATTNKNETLGEKSDIDATRRRSEQRPINHVQCDDEWS